jgi:uncharacterized protein involved in exopolysaccharide biosynthesis
MPEPVEIFRYIRYLRLRWRWIATCCAISVLLAGAVTALQPNQYTATARVLIDPPVGADLRAATAVSPVYLESLKTYEAFAASDSLFEKALQKFGLHYGQPIETVKKRVLKVGLVRNTRILEISATMPDAPAAQKMAEFVAVSTVELSRAVMGEGASDLVSGMEKEREGAQARLQAAEDAWAKVLGSEPVAELQSAMESDADLRGATLKEIARTELELSDAGERLAPGIRAQLAEMRRQLEQLDRRQAERERLLSQRMAHRERLEAERKSRQADLTASETRLREARGDAGYRGERLRIIDPGIVPQKPSSPNLVLNLLAALLAGLVLPVGYLAIEMNYQEQRIAGRREYPAEIRR